MIKVLNKNSINIKIFVFLVLCFSLFISIVYLIPDSLVEKTVSESLNSLNSEGTYPISFLFTESARLDNYTDILMINRNIQIETRYNFFQNAFYNNGYARYWHGYLVLLRPLLIFFNHQQIRYINIIFLFSLFCFTFSKIRDKFGNINGALFILVNALSLFIFVPFSLQFSSVYYISFIAILFILNEKSDKYDVSTIFLCIGMLVNFFDLLTAPVITLGFPIIYYLKKHDNDKKPREVFSEVIRTIFSWFLGYGLTWLTKWIIASLILQTDVIGSSINQMFFRISGQLEYEKINRITMCDLNFKSYFSPMGLSVFAILLCCIVVLILLFIKFKKNYKILKYNLNYLVISVIPLIWINVLMNHSQIHYWFTYRVLSVFLLGILMFVVNSTNFDFLKEKDVEK